MADESKQARREQRSEQSDTRHPLEAAQEVGFVRGGDLPEPSDRLGDHQTADGQDVSTKRLAEAAGQA